MPTPVILATADAALADAWERQVMPGRTTLRPFSTGFPFGSAPAFAAVVILDAASESSLPPTYARCPTIFVGEPHSQPFEQAKMAGRAKVYLSYEDSCVRLRDLLPLLEELAESQSLSAMLAERAKRPDAARPATRPPAPDWMELWDFVEGAVENLDSRERLLAEFRRASRHLLRASHVVFFQREADGFRADRGTSYFPVDDPLVAFFENHPAVIDGTTWEGPSDPVAELAIRNRLALWGARLLAPVHDNGRLLGLIALGVRDDGQPYDELDRNRVIFFARLLRQLLSRSAQFQRLVHLADQAALGAKYLPCTLVLSPNESPPRNVPVIVRELIGQVRRTKEIQRVSPTHEQPFRASAGLIAESGGTWAFWQEASGEVHETATKAFANRRSLLRELALTLSHELGNALVSLATFKQLSPQRDAPLALVETIKGDVAKLESLNDIFSLMETLHESEIGTIDIRDLAQEIGSALNVRVEVGPDSVVLSVNKAALRFSLCSIITSIVENRLDLGAKDLVLKVRSTGSSNDLTALLSIRGKNLQLEGILPEPIESAVPNQGRMAVFLAKEVIKLHHGHIHAGPGIEGSEILISFRRW